MKKKLVMLSLTLAALTADEPVSTLNGAFRQVRNKYGTMTEWRTRDSVTVIKVFRDGYWFGAYFDDKRNGHTSFNGACGGTYELKNGRYVEHVNYYSWDSTAVGNTFVFDYKVTPAEYHQFGKMNSEKYRDYPINEVSTRITAIEPLKNKGLEGVWRMKEGVWKNSKLGEGKYKDVEVIKLFSYPMAVFAYFNPKTKAFVGAGGVRYQYDGQTLTEVNEFWSWAPDGSRKGFKRAHRITLTDGRYVQTSEDGNLHELYERLDTRIK